MRNSIKLTVISLLLLAAMVLTLITGTYSLTPGDLWSIMMNRADSNVNLVFFEFRMPRMLITILCGAALALSGLLLQVVSRNPLADPGIIGVNAGSGFGVVLFLMFLSGGANNLYALPVMSFVSGLATVLAVFALSFIRGRFNSNIFILIGIAMAMGVTGFLYVFTSSFDDRQMTMLNQYLAGNIWGDTWAFVAVILPYIVVVSIFAWMKINEMSMLNMNDDTLGALGMKVNHEKVLLIISAAMLSSAAVSVAGAISFIGLIAPHIARLLFKVEMKFVFLGTLAIGALLLSLSDLLGKLVLEPLIIPAGIVVALIGGPYFIYLLMTARKV
ncbi:FecCD family ABC transporter permease [Lacicoccus alkaliphilus]|uniref:Iron complex transport system permease protein n=1 Tax=Lacicoccus alkaliphilus DSM 16010 TaxID=1123231 RepID=A0A1M7CRU1_9BACL|nr:iron ABC transporter permease [Salinicoccus alkaliphilus]SHL69971.1 iron complex transport system permease protein [Salinicoccus alkaliphilus DSM 16010]